MHLLTVDDVIGTGAGAGAFLTGGAGLLTIGSSCPALGFFVFTTGPWGSAYIITQSIMSVMDTTQMVQSNDVFPHGRLTTSSDFRFEG